MTDKTVNDVWEARTKFISNFMHEHMDKLREHIYMKDVTLSEEGDEGYEKVISVQLNWFGAVSLAVWIVGSLILLFLGHYITLVLVGLLNTYVWSSLVYNLFQVLSCLTRLGEMSRVEERARIDYLSKSGLVGV